MIISNLTTSMIDLNSNIKYHRRLSSGKLLVLSFTTGIVIGTFLLWLPFSTTEEHISLINALFTATSAICVTGLTVVDTGTVFSPAGKIIILFLIQIGGLGIMTFSVMMFLTVGRMPSLRDCYAIENMFCANQKIDIKSLVKAIFFFTIISESLGAVFLFIGWFKTGIPPGEALWNGVFHSISAFCNAGFALYSDSLESFRSDWLICLPVSFLIILGGIGFSVVYELYNYFYQRGRERLSLNTRLVLWTTLILICAGTLLIVFFEANNAFKGMSLPDRILNGFFQSVTARTAGFNTVKTTLLSNASLIVLIMLMFIGASPGSCGGGIRTTSLALLTFLFINRIRGNSQVNISSRTIPERTVKRMISLLMLGGVIVVFSTMVLLVTQTEEYLHPLQRSLFVDYLFESVSALGTVGLSLDTTAGLNSAGKFFIILIMFTGRVGLATFAYELFRKKTIARIEYASEDVML